MLSKLLAILFALALFASTASSTFASTDNLAWDGASHPADGVGDSPVMPE